MDRVDVESLPRQALGPRAQRIATGGESQQRIVEIRRGRVALRVVGGVAGVTGVAQGLRPGSEHRIARLRDVVLPVTDVAFGPAVREERLLVLAAVEELAVARMAGAADLRNAR